MPTLPHKFDQLKITFAAPDQGVSEEVLVIFLGEMAGDDKAGDDKAPAADNSAYATAMRRLLAVGLGSDAGLVEHVAHALKHARFKGKLGDNLKIFTPPANHRSYSRIMLVGYGKTGKDKKPAEKNAPHLAANDQKGLTPAKLADLGAAIVAGLGNVTQKSARVLISGLDPALNEAKTSQTDAAAQLAMGAKLRAWQFETYLTKQKPEDKPSLAELTFVLADAKEAAKKFTDDQNGVADAVNIARYLVAEPANALTPPIYADHLNALKIDGLKIEIFDEKQLEKLKMGAMLGVAQGSLHPPRLVVLSWLGAADKNAAPLALIGKGVTFDSGGLSLKPAKSMEDMKWDMGGSASVVGALIALARRRAKANVVGVVGLVENMPSHLAQRPGDIVTSHSGQTIEVLNTDAEGRLLLADLLSYTEQNFKPAAMIDLATLTGAIITALGHENVGLFANDDGLAAIITDAGLATHEPVWRLPMGDAYDKLIKSDIADMKNIGDGTSGSIVGAQFLQRFVTKTKWAHLDIAGVAWANQAGGVTPKGASGWGVRLLDDLVRKHYES